jgi:GTP cyclohydrolase II
MPPLKLRLRVPAPAEHEAKPLIVHFPSGPPPAASLPKSAASGGAAAAKVEVLGSTSKRKRDQRKVVARLPRHDAGSSAAVASGFVEGEHIVYEGQNFGEGADARTRSQYAVGVYDKKSGELRIVPAQLLALRPVRAKTEVALPEEDEMTQSLYGRQKLTQKFGSVKRKQELVRYKLNELSGENLGSDAAEAFGSQLERSARASESVASKAAEEFEQARSFLPKGYDLETNKEADVYPIDSIIPPSARKFMATQAKEFLAEPPTKHIGKFVGALLESRQSLADEQAVEIYFLQQLVRFARLDDRGLKREDVGKALVGVPDAIVDLLIRSFTTGRDDRLIKNMDGMGDKLYVHMLILALHVSGSWSVQPELLAEDLKLTALRLVVYCREIGCKVKSQPAVDVVGGKRYKATLVAPLKFPEPPRKRQRGQ